MKIKTVNAFTKTLKYPNNFFWRTLAQMAQMGFSQILGPKSKKNSLIALYQTSNIDVKKFQQVFDQLSQIRVSFYLVIGNFFLQKKFFTAQKPNLSKLFFGPKTFSWLLKSNWSTAILHHLARRSNAQLIIFTNVYQNGATSKSLYPICVAFGPMTNFSPTLGSEISTNGK